MSLKGNVAVLNGMPWLYLYIYIFCQCAYCTTTFIENMGKLFHIGLKMVCLGAWKDGSMGNKLAMQAGVHGFRSPTLSYKAGCGSIHLYISTGKWRQDNPRGCWPVGLASWWVLGSTRGSVLKIKVEINRRHPILTSAPCMCSWTQMHTRIFVSLCAHTHTKTYKHTHNISL